MLLATTEGLLLEINARASPRRLWEGEKDTVAMLMSGMTMAMMTQLTAALVAPNDSNFNHAMSLKQKCPQ